MDALWPFALDLPDTGTPACPTAALRRAGTNHGHVWEMWETIYIYRWNPISKKEKITSIFLVTRKSQKFKTPLKNKWLLSKKNLAYNLLSNSPKINRIRHLAAYLRREGN
jgi:hypothetical protein